jgi:hypothetical protein
MKHVVTLQVVLFLFGVTLALGATDQDRARLLEREREKFGKEHDPVTRTKIGIKISDILLEDVAESVKDGEYDVMEQQLTAYADTIETAHRSLIESGRNAAKKPSGFKELEIALRKHVRKLDDFGRVLNLQRRIALDKAKDLATGIRDKLLKALFP